MSYLGSVSEEEGRAILNKMQFLKDDTIAKSKSSTGYLDAIKNGAYFDMWQNLNPRKDGLDHEALTIWQAFEAIDPVTPDVLNNYYPAYTLINEKIKSFNSLLSQIASNPNKYFEMFNTPEVWEDMLNMVLVQTPEAAAEGAARAGLGLLSGAIPIIGFGLLAFWLYNKAKG